MRKILCNNTTGYPNIHYSSSEKRYRGRAWVDGSRVHVKSSRSLQVVVDAMASFIFVDRSVIRDEALKRYKKAML